MSTATKNYPLDVWESVLKDDGFTLTEEKISWQNDTNCLIYDNRIDCLVKIWFDRKTDLIHHIKIDRPFQYQKPEQYIEFNQEKFRHYLIEKII